jgi:phosphonoacetaldehyde hydrolase
MIKAVILDWAGTVVDFGSLAPVGAFLKAFKAFWITPSVEEIRSPMGLEKRLHIETMLKGKNLGEEWRKLYGKAPSAGDISLIYKAFEQALFEVLPNYAALIPGAADTVNKLRGMGIKIGSTTGYSAKMMGILSPAAEKEGYKPDCLVCPEEAGGGRPYPYMLWRNLEKLGIASVHEAIKVGDTEADIEEGKNAGCLSVGIITGSSILGFSESEFNACADIREHMDRAREQFLKAGADAVLDSIAELPGYIDSLK